MVWGQLGDVLGMMLLLLLTGILLKKRNIITENGKKCLTDLLLNAILPCNIVAAFCVDIDLKVLIQLGTLLVTAILIQVFCLILTKTVYNRVAPEQRKIFQYATVCSNAGFIGYSICDGLWGQLGVLYTGIYLIPQRFVMWSAGLSYFTTGNTKGAIFKKVLTHPCVIAVFIGLPILLFGIPLPAPILSTLDKLGGCTTAVSLLVVGAILADVEPKTLLDGRQLYFSLIRLILIPAIVWAGCLLFRLDNLVTGVCVLLAGMPAGSTTSILAYKYHGDAEFASKCVITSTVLSLVTIPIWCILLL